MASVRTNNGIRDNDLRSSNFLDVENYPTMTFKSTGVIPAGPDRYTLTGDLTIKETPARWCSRSPGTASSTTQG